MIKIIPFLIGHGYMVLFAWVFAETMGLPAPSAPLLITMGALAGMGQVSLLLSIGLAACGALAGDIAWYLVGRKRGSRVLTSVCRIALEPDTCVRRTKNIFDSYGARSLLVTKFLPGLNAVATPLAGIIRMPLPRFLPFAFLGKLVWAAAYSLAGYVFSEELERILDYSGRLGLVLLAVAGGALAVYILRKYALRRRFFKEFSIGRITPSELKRKLDAGENVRIIDVRQVPDFEADPYVIPGALRMPLEHIVSAPAESSGGETVVCCTCPDEASRARVAMTLRQKGIKCDRALAGGIGAWRDLGYPLELAATGPP